ncbi:hypothetical protein [Paenibacillus puerhi]|uniref:hypothetical protein n=1 Tax=Paenibacillus puerhi TaxID=2692622 RepID=UPI00135CCAA6|nr:hypothetical protein [Paenibacillus puerhi]
MGYEIHIRRKGDDYPIQMEEWLHYIENDEELTYTNNIEITLPNGMILGMSGEGLAIWKTEYRGEEIEITFMYKNDEISAKYMDDFQIVKMKAIANKLNAIVVGDENEEY